MGWFSISAVKHGAGELLGGWSGQLLRMLFSPGSFYSLFAISCTLAVAAAFTLAARRRSRPVPARVMIRALFPARLVRSASGKADLVFSLFNIFVAGLLFGWAILSGTAVATWTQAGLTSLFGPLQPTSLPRPFCAAIATLALYLAYEFAYWLYHYSSHRLPLLWEFHKVHHSAQSLSPLTNFRVHPVDSIAFYNSTAIVMGTTSGALGFGFGGSISPYTLGGTNILLLAAGAVLMHLQHTHLWISFTGRLGRLILSPAHHQIHHSANPIHFNKNMGASLALFDRLFGTLHVPAKKRETLTFGVPELRYDPHTVHGGMIMPLLEAAARIEAKLIALAAKPRRQGPISMKMVAEEGVEAPAPGA